MEKDLEATDKRATAMAQQLLPPAPEFPGLADGTHGHRNLSSRHVLEP